MDRRLFLFSSSGAVAGSMAVPGLAEAHDGAKPVDAQSGLTTGKMKPLRHKEIPGFLSAAQIAPHHTSHYGGALKAFVGVEEKFEEHFTNGKSIDGAAFDRMKQIQSSRGNSVVLHELYFDGLELMAGVAPDGIKTAINNRFGSVDKWKADFVASAKSAAGWAMLVVHPVNGRLYNVVSDEHAQGPLWLSVPLVVIDTYEHAFYIDYQNNKSDYIENFITHIDWKEADRRFKSV